MLLIYVETAYAWFLVRDLTAVFLVEPWSSLFLRIILFLFSLFSSKLGL